MKYLLIAMCLFVTSCATMFNGSQQQVKFMGGLEKGTTKVSTPNGTFEIEDGQGSFMLTRQKSDISMKVTCPNGKKKNIIAPTSYDWSIGWANIFFYPFFLEAAFADKAYKIDDVRLMGLCPSGS